MKHVLAPLSSKQFCKYLAARVLSSIGSGTYFIALSWFLYHRTSAVASISVMLILTTLPGLFLSPIAGVLLDRWNEKWVCVGAHLLQALILASLVLTIRTDHGVLLAIYAASFLMAACDMVFSPAAGALVRDMTARGSLLDANVLGSTAQQVGVLCGASLGGLLVAKIGATQVIALNVALYCISACLVCSIATRTRKHEGNGAKRPSMMADLRAAAAYVSEQRFILWLAVVQMFDTIVICACNTLLPAFVSRALRAGPEAFGLIDSAWGAGAMLGGMLLAFAARRVDRHLISIVGPLCMSILLVFFLSAHSTLHAIAGYFFLGAVVCAVGVNTSTVLAADVARQHFGKVKMAIAMFTSYASLAVYGLLSVFGDKVSLRWLYLALSAFVMSGCLLKIGRTYRHAKQYARELSTLSEDKTPGFDL
jgi:predicted MFS family arabinose efflux permease